MAAKKQSASDKAQYATYQSAGVYAKNKAAKIARHIKRFPNDVNAAAAVKAISSTPTRKTPSNTVWSTDTRRMAQLLRSFGMNGNLALRSLDGREQYLTAQ